jgi:hypothetical protein
MWLPDGWGSVAAYAAEDTVLPYEVSLTHRPAFEDARVLACGRGRAGRLGVAHRGGARRCGPGSFRECPAGPSCRRHNRRRVSRCTASNTSMKSGGRLHGEAGGPTPSQACSRVGQAARSGQGSKRGHSSGLNDFLLRPAARRSHLYADPDVARIAGTSASSQVSRGSHHGSQSPWEHGRGRTWSGAADTLVRDVPLAWPAGFTLHY